MDNMTVDVKNNYSILVGTLKKAFKEAKRKGTYSVKELFLLNTIFKILSFGCNIGMTKTQQRELTVLYFNILRSSEKFCIYEFESKYYKSIAFNNGVFVQRNENSAPTVVDFFIGDVNTTIPVDTTIPTQPPIPAVPPVAPVPTDTTEETNPTSASAFNSQFNIKFN